MKRLWAAIAWVAPAFAQYAGPAILSRGDAPSAMSNAQISFSPFVEFSAVYSTGLAAVAVNSAGEIANSSAEGVELGFGVSGSHSWRRTSIGLSYMGDVRHYSLQTYFDGVDQSFLLGLRHQFSRHVFFNLQTSAGLFSRNSGVVGLPQTVPFDPSQSFIPTTDFFDNRTIYGGAMADLVLQKSTRLSFDFGGGEFLNRRRSSALYGVTGTMARADMQYRATRRTTLGINYVYSRFRFRGIFSSTDMHGINATYAIQLTRRLEFSAYGGALRAETKFIQSVPVDPAVAAIIGTSQGSAIIYGIIYVPNVSARLSRSFPRGTLYVSGGHTITPGNGLFLTSKSTSISVGYSYTGLRLWSLNTAFDYSANSSIGNVVGRYSGASGTLTASRKLKYGFHAITSVAGRSYGSGDFTGYNRVVYEARLGVGYTPGSLPLRMW